jgi:tetratricopeptide (TPR) repeat protein
MRFSMAYNLARAAGDDTLELVCAASLYLAAMCGHAVVASAGLADVAAAMAGLLRDVHARHSPDKLVEQLKPRELARLAFCVSHIGRHDTAEAATTRAIALEPAFEDSYWLRATARFKQGRAQDALADVETFLEINERDMAEFRRQRSATHPANNIELRRIDGGMAECVHRRTTVLELAVSAAAYLKDFDLAEKYLRLLQTLHPERTDVAMRIAAIEAGRSAMGGAAGPG